MRLALILLVLVSVLLSFAASAPAKTKKAKQLVYFAPGKARTAVVPVQNVQNDQEDADDEEDEDADEGDEDADDEGADDDADDDLGLNIPDFNKVFPNPDGRPAGPNSYDAFMRHKPGGHASSGPAAAGSAGPRVAGQAGPRVSGQAGPGQGGHGQGGPGQRRTNHYLGRVDLDDYVDPELIPYGYGPPPPGSRLVQFVADDPTSTSTEETDNFYPKRDGRQGNVVVNRATPNYRYRPMSVAPVYNRRVYNNYLPYRNPGSVYYSNRPMASYYPNRVVQGSRPVYSYGVNPVRRTVVQASQVPVRRTVVPMPMSSSEPPRVGGGYTVAVPQTRVGQSRGFYNPWSYSPLRGDNYNPEYVINPTEMLSRRKIRYHPSQRMPIQRIPLNSGGWGNPREIQRDPWTGSQYHGGYLHSQI